MNTIYRLSLFIFILATCIGCDQTTKTIARMSLADAQPISFLNNTVRFEYAENHGGFMSLGSTLPENIRFLLLTVATTVMMIAVLFLHSVHSIYTFFSCWG